MLKSLSEEHWEICEFDPNHNRALDRAGAIIADPGLANVDYLSERTIVMRRKIILSQPGDNINFVDRGVN